MTTFNRGQFDQMIVEPTLFLAGKHPANVLAEFQEVVGETAVSQLDGLRSGAAQDAANCWFVRRHLVQLLDGVAPSANVDQQALITSVVGGSSLDLSLPGFEGSDSPPLLRWSNKGEGNWFIRIGNGDEVSVPTANAAVEWLVESLRIA